CVSQSHLAGSWTTTEPNQDAIRPRSWIHAWRPYRICGRLLPVWLSPTRFSRSEFLSFPTFAGTPARQHVSETRVGHFPPVREGKTLFTRVPRHADAGRTGNTFLRWSPMKVALVHVWFTAWAGSENVVEQILACFPEADLFALVDFLP